MEPFQAVGLALVVAAIIGGGLEAAGFVKIGVVQSLPRQLMLGGLGVALFVAGTPEVWSWFRPAPPPVVPVMVTATPPPAPTIAPMPTTPPAPTATPAPSATSVPEPTASQAAAPASAPAATSPPAATSAPAPAGRTPILPGIRKDRP